MQTRGSRKAGWFLLVICIAVGILNYVDGNQVMAALLMLACISIAAIQFSNRNKIVD